MDWFHYMLLGLNALLLVLFIARSAPQHWVVPAASGAGEAASAEGAIAGGVSLRMSAWGESWEHWGKRLMLGKLRKALFLDYTSPSPPGVTIHGRDCTSCRRGELCAFRVSVRAPAHWAEEVLQARKRSWWKRELTVTMRGAASGAGDVRCLDPPRCREMSVAYRLWDVGEYLQLSTTLSPGASPFCTAPHPTPHTRSFTAAAAGVSPLVQLPTIPPHNQIKSHPRNPPPHFPTSKQPRHT
ncbi:hypothetical protein CLOP_g7441 [Closterium sp. NIES-67]|nr:hypothetical protein CLOP_g7441 [Closterium sp. NIES-67]